MDMIEPTTPLPHHHRIDGFHLDRSHVICSSLLSA
jgi:hypothetical protein